jgi:putative ABC transport system permease protein
LPVLALVSGSILASASVALQTLTHGAVAERGAIEARMAQGARRFSAFAPLLRHTLKAALSPFLQAMSASGLLALPGTMAGQILAGADPFAAATYQVLLTVALAGAGALGALTVALGGVLLLSDRRHRLRLDRLRQVAPSATTTSAMIAGRRLVARIASAWLRRGSGAFP